MALCRPTAWAAIGTPASKRWGGGVWVEHADGTRLGQEDQAILEPVTQKQIDSALTAAEAVGDDRIQEQLQGRVTPETGLTAPPSSGSSGS